MTKIRLVWLISEQKTCVYQKKAVPLQRILSKKAGKKSCRNSIYEKDSQFIIAPTSLSVCHGGRGELDGAGPSGHGFLTD